MLGGIYSIRFVSLSTVRGAIISFPRALVEIRVSRLFSGLSFGLPVVLGLLSLPLALGVIGPNTIYGYRTAKSLSSPEAWYAANMTAGWIGMGFALIGLFITVSIIKMNFPTHRHRYLAASMSFGGLMLLSALAQYGANG